MTYLEYQQKKANAANLADKMDKILDTTKGVDRFQGLMPEDMFSAMKRAIDIAPTPELKQDQERQFANAYFLQHLTPLQPRGTVANANRLAAALAPHIRTPDGVLKYTGNKFMAGLTMAQIAEIHNQQASGKSEPWQEKRLEMLNNKYLQYSDVITDSGFVSGSGWAAEQFGLIGKTVLESAAVSMAAGAVIGALGGGVGAAPGSALGAGAGLVKGAATAERILAGTKFLKDAKTASALVGLAGSIGGLKSNFALQRGLSRKQMLEAGMDEPTANAYSAMAGNIGVSLDLLFGALPIEGAATNWLSNKVTSKLLSKNAVSGMLPSLRLRGSA